MLFRLSQVSQFRPFKITLGQDRPGYVRLGQISSDCYLRSGNVKIDLITTG